MHLYIYCCLPTSICCLRRQHFAAFRHSLCFNTHLTDTVNRGSTGVCHAKGESPVVEVRRKEMWSESPFERSAVLVSLVLSCHTQKHLLWVQEAALCELYSCIPHVPESVNQTQWCIQAGREDRDTYQLQFRHYTNCKPRSPPYRMASITTAQVLKTCNPGLL